MPAYDDSSFSPPAPIALVALRNSQTGAISPDVPMLIDSGADVTLVPRQSATMVGATIETGNRYGLLAFDGSSSTVDSVELDLVFLRRAFKGRLLLIDQAWGILGRDILNHLPPLLDGPNLNWIDNRSARP